MPPKVLTFVKVAFGFCIIIGVFEETVAWTIDLPQVRKYFFEKSLADREKHDMEMKLEEEYMAKDKVVYDNIDTHSLHTDYDKYREHYADDYKYHGYMEQKVHEAVRNGSAYLEGLRRAIEAYTRRLESCRQQNVTANIIQFRPDFLNLTNSNLFSNLTDPNTALPAIIASLPPNSTYISQMSANFTSFMAMSPNYTMFNVSDGFRECMRADLASEHVRRLAELAVWAASELQDKLYAEKYEKHGHDHERLHDAHGVTNDVHERGHDDALVLRLAWFLDRLAHLTGYDPRPGEFAEKEREPTSTETPFMLSMVPTLVSTEDLQRMMGCMNGTGGIAPDRCAFVPRREPNPDSYMSRGMPVPPMPTYTSDLRTSGSENQEYTYSEQDFTDDDMPLSLPQRPATKRKRSVQGDPLQNFIQYYAKYKTWTGANQDEKHSPEMSHVNSNKENVEEHNNAIRTKRFIVKKWKQHKIENPFPDLSKIVKHKLTVHVKKDEKEAKLVKKFIDILHKPKTELKFLKLKKSKRSIQYSKKQLPRVPTDPQGDISYYLKNKPGRTYNYNPVQAALVRAGLEQVFQTGNILVVQRYGSNYNPANRMQILEGYLRGYADV